MPFMGARFLTINLTSTKHEEGETRDEETERSTTEGPAQGRLVKTNHQYYVSRLLSDSEAAVLILKFRKMRLDCVITPLGAGTMIEFMKE